MRLVNAQDEDDAFKLSLSYIVMEKRRDLYIENIVLHAILESGTEVQ